MKVKKSTFDNLPISLQFRKLRDDQYHEVLLRQLHIYIGVRMTTDFLKNIIQLVGAICCLLILETKLESPRNIQLLLV